MASKNEIDALVHLLDQQMNQGSKHVNINCEDPENIEIEKTTIASGCDCNIGDNACMIPNLNVGYRHD